MKKLKPANPRFELFQRLGVRVRCVVKPRGDFATLLGVEGDLIDVQQTKATVRFDDHGLCHIPMKALGPAGPSVAAPRERPETSRPASE